ncbi:unnamed protein product [Ambrosiozyma monospora]|uniref:Unnamed protein product n=1 Tax=Ambrosiozyma monospora TaxID=43982 RepID=A0ACB5U6E7_AMBMO|nr:unnamed protein product [Ambrosiozyma monospora]
MNWQHLLVLFTIFYPITVAATATWKTSFNGRKGAAEFWSCDSAMTSSYVYDFVPGFSPGKYAAYYDTMCQYPPSTGSLLLCVQKVTGHDVNQMEKTFKYFSENCEEYTGFVAPWTFYRDQYLNATEYEISSSSIKNVSLPVYYPALPNMTNAMAIYEAYKPFYKNLDGATSYGSGLLVYFGVVMLLATIGNFAKRTGLAQKFSNPLINWFRSYVTLPAMLPKGKHARPWGGWKVFTAQMPDRWDTLVCFIFTILHVVFWAIPYNADPSHAVLWDSYAKELQRYLADRTGIIAFAEVPLLVLFAGRNNILTFITVNLKIFIGLVVLSPLCLLVCYGSSPSMSSETIGMKLSFTHTLSWL